MEDCVAVVAEAGEVPDSVSLRLRLIGKFKVRRFAWRVVGFARGGKESRFLWVTDDPEADSGTSFISGRAKLSPVILVLSMVGQPAGEVNSMHMYKTMEKKENNF